MADNTTLNVATTAGPVMRTIDKAAKQTQVVTLDLGGAGAELLVNGSLPVTGSFFQATQPVSGTVALDTASLAALETISVANFPATQPVSAASLPLPAGAATETTLAALNTKVTAVNTGAVVLAAGAASIGSLAANQSVNNAQIAGVATAVGAGVSGTGVQRVVLATDVVQPAVSEIRAATLHVTATAAVNTAVTASLPAPAAGLFQYITAIQVTKLYSVLGVAAGAGVIVTTTNLPGTPAWTTEQAAGAVGTAPMVINYQPTTPLRAAAAATAVTVVCPAQLQTIWRINVSYFTAA